MTRIGIDLGGTKVEGVLLDDAGEVRERTRISTPREQGYEAILQTVADLVRQLTDRADDGDPTIGIGTPGSTNPRTGLLRNCNTTCLNGRPLASDLEAVLGRTVTLANDANCFAVAEATRCAGRGHRVVFGVILGTGVGGGVVIDGRVHTGRLGVGGEWGHTCLEHGGATCYCGARGCVENVLSGTALEARWAALTGERVALADLVASGRLHEDGVGADFRTSWRDSFATALANVVDVLDPDAIVLGGGVSNVPFLYDEFADAVRARVFCDEADTPILPNELGDSAGVFGAALL